MKNHSQIKVILMAITFFTCLHAYGAGDFNARIKVDKAQRTLIAPESSNYTWYLNNERLSGEGRVIELEASGIYAVTVTDEEGHEMTRSVQVSIDDQGQIYVIYIIGDSTVSNYNASYYPMTGWGQVLQRFFNSSNVVISNRAIGGRSAKSFYNDHWSDVIDDVQAGDYVFVQFGINDAASDPNRYSAPWEGFQDYLTLFVNETEAKGATCVLVATLRRNSWNATNPPTLYDAYHDYPVATRALAQELDVPLIDLDQAAVPLMEPLGPDYTGPFMYMNLNSGEYANYPTGLGDNVHFQEMGAIEMAKLVVQEVQEQAASFPVMNLLVPSLRPLYMVTVNKNNSAGGIVTRTQSFPAGVNVTLKAIPNENYLFQGWQNSSGSIVSTSLMYSFTMGSSATSYTALFSWNENCSVITPYAQVNGGTWQQLSDVSVSTGDQVKFGPHPSSGGSWAWSGPDGFTATTREITIGSIQTSQAGAYVAALCSGSGCLSTHSFTMVVDGQSNADGKVVLTAIANSGTVKLFWELSNITTGLQIMRDTDSDPAGRERIAIVGNSTSAYADTDVVDGTTYYYWIKAVDINGKTINSNGASATPGGSSDGSTITIEENGAGFCGVDGSIDSNNIGYSGIGFANTDNVSGSGIDWHIDGDGGDYTFRWNFANGEVDSRLATLSVGGNTVSSVNFVSTGSWTEWSTLEVAVSNVSSGIKTIRLEADGGEGLPNVDYLQITASGVAAAGCTTGRFASGEMVPQFALKDQMVIYPVPVFDDLAVELGNESSANAWIFDVSGKVLLQKVLTGSDHHINVSGLVKGVYYIELRTASGSYRLRFIKK